MTCTVILFMKKSRIAQVKQQKNPSIYIKKRSKESQLVYLFQGQSKISQHCFNIGPYCIDDNFMTRDPGLFKRLYHKHFPVQSNKYWFTFSVPIGTAKKVH